MKADIVSVCCMYFLWPLVVFNHLHTSGKPLKPGIEPFKPGKPLKRNVVNNGKSFETTQPTVTPSITASTAINTFLQKKKVEEQLAIDEEILQSIGSIDDLRNVVKNILFGAYLNIENLKADVEKWKIDSEKWKIDSVLKDARLKQVYSFYSRLLSCGDNLRFAMEMLPSYRQTNVHKQINKKWEEKTNALEVAAKSLAKAAIETNENTPLFRNAFEKLKQIELTKSTYAAETELGKELIKLQSAPTEAEAKIIWIAEKKLWKAYSNCSELPAPDKLFLQDISKLTRLELQEIREDGNKKAYMLEKPTELNYALDYMELGHKKSPGARYNKCTWVMHREDRSYVFNILAVLEKNWTDLPNRSDRVHEYCIEYETLYSVLSKRTQHKPAPQPPFPECKPDSDDFEEFLQLTGIKIEPRRNLVARTLYRSYYLEFVN
ncbi:uncharacterized protein LOC135840672 isoform X2 [Planococcus citri]